MQSLPCGPEGPSADSDPLRSLQAAEAARLGHRKGPLLLQEEDLARLTLDLVKLRLQEKLSLLTNKATNYLRDPLSTSSLARKRSRRLVNRTYAVLQLVAPLELFGLDSPGLGALSGLIEILTRMLLELAYTPKDNDPIISNEWYLIQNDLAYFLELADYAPPIAPCIATGFGHIYTSKRVEMLNWTVARLATTDSMPFAELLELLDQTRLRIIAAYGCTRNFSDSFAMDTRFDIHTDIDRAKLEALLADCGFLRVNGLVQGHQVYMTKALAVTPAFLAKFLSTRNNQPEAFQADLIFVLPTDSAFIKGPPLEQMDEVEVPSLAASPWFARDLAAFSRDEVLMSGRSTRHMDTILHRFSAAGFRFQASFYREAEAPPFPFDYYSVMRTMREMGILSGIEMLQLASKVLDRAENRGCSPEHFNRVNASMLYSIEFCAIALRLSLIRYDSLMARLAEAFLEAAVKWLSWLSTTVDPVISSRVVSRWTVSAFDMIVPLVYIHPLNLPDRLNEKQRVTLRSALHVLDQRKKLARPTDSVVESVSEFKWKRVCHTIKCLLDKDQAQLKPFKCEPMPMRFLPPFEEFISSALEKALAPLHYQLVSQLYTGPNSTLFECVDLNTGNLVACKQFTISNRPVSPLSASSADSSVELKEALKESEVLRAVQGHPNILKYIRSTFEPPYFFLFTEYCNGGSLASNKILCQRNPDIEESPAVWVARFKVLCEIKECLAYLHERGVVHGDIKPANILFDSYGKVHIGDFGSAHLVKRDPEHRMPLCVENGTDLRLENHTIPYMAPELLKAYTPTWASDIWSYGCLVLEVVTGLPPWFGLDGSEILVRLAAAKSPLDYAAERLREVPLEFMQTIQGCLVADPDQRPTARELLEEHYR